jgi:hypothetical protein
MSLSTRSKRPWAFLGISHLLRVAAHAGQKFLRDLRHPRIVLYQQLPASGGRRSAARRSLGHGLGGSARKVERTRVLALGDSEVFNCNRDRAALRRVGIRTDAFSPPVAGVKTLHYARTARRSFRYRRYLRPSGHYRKANRGEQPKKRRNECARWNPALLWFIAVGRVTVQYRQTTHNDDDQ